MLALAAGAIVGLAAMGPQVVRMQLLPNLEPYVALLEREMGEGEAGGSAPRPSPLRRQEAAWCFGALLAASAGAMYHRITQRWGPSRFTSLQSRCSLIASASRVRLEPTLRPYAAFAHRGAGCLLSTTRRTVMSLALQVLGAHHCPA